MILRFNLPRLEEFVRFMYSPAEDKTIEIMVLPSDFMHEYLGILGVPGADCVRVSMPDGAVHEIHAGDIVVFDRCYMNESFVLLHVNLLEYQGITTITEEDLERRGFDVLHTAPHLVRFHTDEELLIRVERPAALSGMAIGVPSLPSEVALGVPVGRP